MRRFHSGSTDFWRRSRPDDWLQRAPEPSFRFPQPRLLRSAAWLGKLIVQPDAMIALPPRPRYVDLYESFPLQGSDERANLVTTQNSFQDIWCAAVRDNSYCVALARCMDCGFDFGPHTAATVAGFRIRFHVLALKFRNQRCVGILRMKVIDAIDVGEKDEQISMKFARDQRCEHIVLGERAGGVVFDLGTANCIVLIENW